MGFSTEDVGRGTSRDLFRWRRWNPSKGLMRMRDTKKTLGRLTSCSRETLNGWHTVVQLRCRSVFRAARQPKPPWVLWVITLLLNWACSAMPACHSNPIPHLQSRALGKAIHFLFASLSEMVISRSQWVLMSWCGYVVWHNYRYLHCLEFSVTAISHMLWSIFQVQWC